MGQEAEAVKVRPTAVEVLGGVSRAIKEAEMQHGPLPSDPIRASAILGEEYGEVCRAALELTRPWYNTQGPHTRADVRREQLVHELEQVAAVCFLWIMNIQEEER